VKQDPSASGKLIVSGWVRGELARLLNELGGRHEKVMVAGVVLLDEDGFDVGTREQTQEMDPAAFGPMMLQGYNVMAGRALANVLKTVDAATRNPQHFTASIDDPAEKLQAMRNLYEAAIRQFLDGMFTYAGIAFQDQQLPGPSIAAGSQMLAAWLHVARARLKFLDKSPDPPEEAPEPQEPADDDRTDTKS
jgi:hypothetical protein